MDAKILQLLPNFKQLLVRNEALFLESTLMYKQVATGWPAHCINIHIASVCMFSVIKVTCSQQLSLIAAVDKHYLNSHNYIHVHV